jgi:hypothetical protein
VSYTPHQRGIIRRYYEHRDDLMVQKLGDIVSSLYLAESDKEKQRLWSQAETALGNLEVPKGQIQRVMSERDPALLAKVLEGLY